MRNSDQGRRISGIMVYGLLKMRQRRLIRVRGLLVPGVASTQKAPHRFRIRRRSFPGNGLVPYGCNKPVAFPGYSFDDSWMCRIVPQSAAELPNCRVHGTLALEIVVNTPDMGQDLVPRDQARPVADQENHQLHGNPLQPNGPPILS